MPGTCRDIVPFCPVLSPLRRDRTGRDPIRVPFCPVRQLLSSAWLFWHAHPAYASASQTSVRPFGSTCTPIRLRTCARSTQRKNRFLRVSCFSSVALSCATHVL